MDLIGYLYSTKHVDYFSSFSLGIDDEIIDEACQDINAEHESDLNADNDTITTLKPTIREKSTRLMKLTRYGNSPYIERYPTLNETKSVATPYPLFAEYMDEILKRFKNEKLENVDMVFFPIYAYEHYYLICYNLKNPAYELIDNVERDEDPKVYYGAKPRIPHSHFRKYLQAKGHLNLSKTIRKLKPNYIRMPWQTTKNAKDCGIFLMRHMETYKADTKTWDTRFKEERHGHVPQIIKIRVKYNNVILSSKLNEKREAILKEGHYLYNESAANRVLNLVIQSSQEEQKSAKKNKSEKKKTISFTKYLTMTLEED
ncbi:hypothetical protein POM88_021773 [Heracleum sosnowskyi]|uniref:Ubiquitin-like protease family profile domain-containing protein n=1 Tax=Heracleum sosnowskyi TaxID=360622 RepID=A0AAD8IF72_9APIA|nr:hypothetical protein POM88_021773 [Heracleum sosnowskyi]